MYHSTVQVWLICDWAGWYLTGYGRGPVRTPLRPVLGHICTIYTIPCSSHIHIFTHILHRYYMLHTYYTYINIYDTCHRYDMSHDRYDHTRCHTTHVHLTYHMYICVYILIHTLFLYTVLLYICMYMLIHIYVIVTGMVMSGVRSGDMSDLMSDLMSGSGRCHLVSDMYHMCVTCTYMCTY